MKYLGNYINGKFQIPQGEVKGLLSEDPGNLSLPVGEVLFSKEAVAPAVKAARLAFQKWSRFSFQNRAKFIRQFQVACQKKKEILAHLISQEMGKPLEESRAEIDRIANKIDIALKEEPRLLKSSKHEVTKGVVGIYEYQPRGVLAILSPFNVPVYLATSQMIPAILYGNTIVLKPSEITPFAGQFLAELWNQTNLPTGVINMIQGTGEVGAALVNHRDVDGVLFTGSWATGLKIQSQLLTQPQKLCALEMGGKNAAVILKDADLEIALQETIKGAYLTSGQRCNATSRIILEKNVDKKFVGAFLEKASKLKIGYYKEDNVFMGPLATSKGFERAQQLISQAKKEGFETFLKSEAFDHPQNRGYYLKPSVHLRSGAPDFDLTENSYADEEILAPDVAIYTVKNAEEALALNNRSFYGLVTSIFTRSRKNFEVFHKKAQSGIVNWNVATVTGSSRLPFGGLKRSGNHRPAGFLTAYLCTIPKASLERKTK